MTYALHDAFYRAADDPEVKVVVLAGAAADSLGGMDVLTLKGAAMKEANG